MPSPISLFLKGSLLGISAGAAPGPLLAYLISETVSGGWRRSLPLVFVPIISDIPSIILTTLVLNQFSDYVLKAISFIGGLFVIYLAWGFWKQWKDSTHNQIPTANLQSRSFGKAVTMNILNPNPYIFWALVSGPILIKSFGQSWLHAVAFLAGFYGCFLLTMIAFIALFHQTRRFGPKVVRAIQIISIFILVIFGSLLIKEGVYG